MSMLKSNWGVGWSASEAIHNAVLMKRVILGEAYASLMDAGNEQEDSQVLS